VDEGFESIEGEIDLATIEEVTTRVLANPAKTVVLDASQLTFIDSAGLRGLINAQNTLAEQGRKLTIANRPQMLVRLLEITGMTDYF